MITARENPKAPHNQPFNIKNIKPSKRKYSWWKKGAHGK